MTIVLAAVLVLALALALMPRISTGVNPKSFTTEVPVDGCVQRANAGFLAPGQSKLGVNIDNIGNTGGVTVPLPTPPTGQMWMITDFSITHNETSAASLRGAILVGAIAVWTSIIHNASPDFVTGMETQIDVPQLQAPSFTLASGGAGGVAFANFYGVVQAVGYG